MTELIERSRGLTHNAALKNVSIFVPLYLDNQCVNECQYCAFRISNQTLKRSTLTLLQLKNQIDILVKRGYRDVLLVTSERDTPTSNALLTQTIEYIKSHTPIAHVALNIGRRSLQTLRQFKKVKADTYQLYQETYDQKIYETLHLAGPKSDYEMRKHLPELAIQSNFKNIGLGILLGLAEPLADFSALQNHARELLKKYPEVKLSFALPRIQPLPEQKFEFSVHPVSDPLLKSFIVVLRKEFPQSNIVLTTRESFALRLECIELGVNRISLEASTQPGGYTDGKINIDSNQIQFPVKENMEITRALAHMKKYSVSGLEK